MKLKQPDPQKIDVDYIESLLPDFYDDSLLVIDCSGYMTDVVMTAIAKRNNIYTDVAWNANREKLAESLTGIDHITPLPIAISANGEIRCLKKSKNEPWRK